MKNKTIRLIIYLTIVFVVVFGLVVCIGGCDKFADNVNNPTDIMNETTVSEHQHSHVFKTTVFEAACEVEGYTLYECECGYNEFRDKVPMLLHDFKTETVSPTCTALGYDKHTCKLCNYSYITHPILEAPKGHKYSEQITKPTCTEQGFTTYTCEQCKEQYNDDFVKAIGHKYEKTVINSTYTEKGYDVYKCSVCGHSYKENYTAVLPHEHEYISKIIKPTCIENGYTTYRCKICQHEYSDSKVNALGHDYTVETIKPTAKEKGYDLHTCSQCKTSYKDNYTDPIVTYKEVNETVYAKSDVNIRKGPSTDFEKIGQLVKGNTIVRIAIGDNGWSKVMYNNEVAYIHSDYLTTEKPPVVSESGYPKTYSDSTCTITIYKEWYKNAYVYAAHLQFTDYSRFGTDCANGKYNNGYETTSHAAKRLGAVFCVNGCYSSHSLNYTVVRSGKIWNGANRNLWVPAVYSRNTGLFLSAWETGGTPGIAGQNVQTLVDEGKITDTFCFGPPSLSGGVLLGKNEGARAQRTFIGTNGNAGDIWVCVSDGRYNDGSSAGLTFYEAAEYLQTKGCTFGIHLDGGGSSTMYFNGKVLNAASGGQRAVVDFVYFR